MSQLKVTQVRSVIDRPKDQKDTIRRLGLRRMHDTVIKEDRPEIRGMLAKVRHLVTVEEVTGTARARRPRKHEQPEASAKEEGDQ